MNDTDRKAVRWVGGLFMFLSSAAFVAIFAALFIGEFVAINLGLFVFGFLLFAAGNTNNEEDN